MPQPSSVGVSLGLSLPDGSSKTVQLGMFGHHGLPFGLTNPCLITSVARSSLGATHGVEVGWVVTSVNGQPTSGLTDPLAVTKLIGEQRRRLRAQNVHTSGQCQESFLCKSIG